MVSAYFFLGSTGVIAWQSFWIARRALHRRGGTHRGARQGAGRNGHGNSISIFTGPLAPVFSCSLPSTAQPRSTPASFQQLGQFSCRPHKNRRVFHSVFRYANDFSHPLPRISRGSRQDRRPSPVVPGESAVRHLRNASLVSFFCTATSGIVGRILDRVGRASSSSSTSFLRRSRRQGLESRNCQEPGGNGGSAFEFASLTPHVEKKTSLMRFLPHLFVPHEPKPEAKHTLDMVPFPYSTCMASRVALSDPERSRTSSEAACCRTPMAVLARLVSLDWRGGSIAKARFLQIIATGA